VISSAHRLGFLGFALILSVSAEAQAPAGAPPAAAAAAPAGVAVQAVVRAEYLAGEKIVVPVVFSNDTAGPLTAPDLGSRPWLVEFQLTSPTGGVQRRKSTPPAADSGRTVAVAPRGRRQTLLEVPGAGALPAGEWSLGVKVELPQGPVELPAKPIRLAPPRPVAGDLGPHGAEPGPGAWVHAGKDGFDLYLNLPAAGAQPEANWFLRRLPAAVEPVLASSRGQEEGNRHVVWLEGGRALVALQLQGVEARGEPHQVPLPWPKVELVGGAVTDARGDVHVPVWVPAPKGEGGELRVVSVDARGTPVFRRVGRLAARPLHVESRADAAGTAQVLVVGPAAVDVWAVRAGPAPDLPLPGKRIFTAPAGEVLVGAAFGRLDRAGEQAGGLAVLVAAVGEAGLRARWVALQGGELRALDPVPWAAGSVLLGLVPSPAGVAGLVVRPPAGAPVYREGARSVALPGGSGGAWSIQRDAAGEARLRRLGDGGPVKVEKLLGPAG